MKGKKKSELYFLVIGFGGLQCASDSPSAVPESPA